MKTRIAILLSTLVLTFETTAFGAVTRTSPAFHNPGHIRMWNQSFLQPFNPHILMIVLGAIIVAGIGYYTFFKFKPSMNELGNNGDMEEAMFRQLISKQDAIMAKIVELQAAFEKGQISKEEYTKKMTEYKHYLVKLKLSMRAYI